MSYELWITSYEFKAGKHELKFKSASSNSRVTNLDSHVTSSNQKQQIESLSAYLHEVWHPLLLYTAGCILDDPPIPHELRTYSNW